MRVLFMGYGSLGENVLRGIVEHHQVVAVLTHPSGFSGIDEPGVEKAARELGLPVLLSARAAETGLHEQLRALDPEAILSTNWRTTVPGDVLDVPKRGAVNIHDALLPRYAGFGAVNWAIRNGEKETGLTAHYMTAELDSGPVLTATRVTIGEHDTAGELLDKLLAEYVPTTLRALSLAEQGYEGTEQDLGQSSFYHRIGTEDAHIRWDSTSQEIYDLIRGQIGPFLPAWTWHEGRPLTILEAAIPRRAYRGTPGHVMRRAEGGVAIACGCHEDPRCRGVIVHRVALEGEPWVLATDYFASFHSILQ